MPVVLLDESLWSNICLFLGPQYDNVRNIFRNHGIKAKLAPGDTCNMGVVNSMWRLKGQFNSALIFYWLQLPQTKIVNITSEWTAFETYIFFLLNNVNAMELIYMRLLLFNVITVIKII